MTIEVFQANYADPVQAAAIVALLDGYARDPMGGGIPLSDTVRADLVAALAALPTAFSILALEDGVPAGLANCFRGFSTFACKPLINIHDVVVDPAYRGRGLARAMFARIEEIARAGGCCKITLEVLTGNGPATALYRALGYGDYVLDPAHGSAAFWQKTL